jgi:hypothetical protein
LEGRCERRFHCLLIVHFSVNFKDNQKREGGLWMKKKVSERAGASFSQGFN